MTDSIFNNKMNGKKSIAWINTTKAICLFLVYLCHSQSRNDIYIPYEQYLVDPFFVNIFFFITGYLIFKKQFDDKSIALNPTEWIKTNGKTMATNVLCRIIFPTILFSSLLFLPKVFLRNNQWNFFSFLSDTIGGGSAWFTNALAVAELLLVVILFFKRGNYYYLLGTSTVFLFLAVWIKHIDPTPIPYWYKSGMAALLPISVGGLYWKLEKYIDYCFNHSWCIVVGLAAYFFIMLASGVEVSFNVPHVEFTVVGFMAFVVSSLIVIALSKKAPEYRFVQFIGSNTLPLYLLSGATPEFTGIVLRRLVPGLNNYLALPIILIISFGISLAVTLLIIRFVPWVLDCRLLNNNKNQ